MPTGTEHLKAVSPLRVTAVANTDVDWQRLARVHTHPLRVSVLEVLGIDGGRTMSPNDLHHELQVPLANVNYHVTELAKSGFLTMSHRRRVRGATEHFYRLAGGGHAPMSNGTMSNGK